RLSLTPPPHRSPLLPYTTLFRSRVAETQPFPKIEDHAARVGDSAGHEPQERAAGDGREEGFDRDQADPTHHDVDQRRDEIETAEDRKSTRLNSSHLVISYAVFCL